jgi:VIT1/CCC1 family predicted Fe2+/Mn2+ transporter
MAELIVTTLARAERSEPLRIAALWAVTVVLGAAFLALLVGDQVRAASF